MNERFLDIESKTIEALKGKSARIGLAHTLTLCAFLILAALTLGISLLFSGFIWINFDAYLLSLKEKEKYRFFDYFKAFNFVKAFLYSVLRRCVLLILTVLLVFPAVIFTINGAFVNFILAENNKLSVFDAYAKSKAISKNCRKDILYIYYKCILPIFLTILTLGLFAFWSVPYIRMLKLQLYLSLESEKENIPTQI